MEKISDIIYEDQNFKCLKIGKIGIMKIKNNVFKIITSLNEYEKFIGYMNVLESDKSISAIVFFNEKRALGNEEFKNYLKNITTDEANDDAFNKLRILNNETRNRKHIIINNIISHIIRSKKIIVNAADGEIVTPFFGAALAADLRLASEETKFILSHSQMNIHPTGAVPYFLPKYLGHAKASQILLVSDKITAKEALDLGLVYEVLPAENYEEQCLEVVNKIISRGDTAIKSTIKMLAYNFQDLVEYTNMEECEYAAI
ncbi:MAG: enoyl-CoA hydratase/isomerase family protein [Ignavibacteriae bacterium]|jgi:enoyl-CoA hydratase/carnithine racemase|nr:enoyl-CoA hydratase/isomerase family protein [Ignavibacteriota bacterium]NOG98637.1 enoyl-CoA hydratase/isomerase family protein [Ignavibacteriota bacterium]